MVALGLFAGEAAAQECRPTTLSNERVNAVRKEIVTVRSSAILMRLTYSQPDAPPQIDTLYAGGESRFNEAIVAEVRQLRTPCASPDHPVSVIEFARLTGWQGGYERFDRRLKRQLQLADVMKMTKQSKRQPAPIDTRTMGCPFKLLFYPFQPYMDNVVRDSAPRPQRMPLLAWLQSVTLNIPDDMMPTAIGQPSVVEVPCAVLDLS